jgi:hypothetical protein
VSPVRYKLDFYIPEDGILHSHGGENLKSYIVRLQFGRILTLRDRLTNGSNISKIPSSPALPFRCSALA